MGKLKGYAMTGAIAIACIVLLKKFAPGVAAKIGI